MESRIPENPQRIVKILWAVLLLGCLFVPRFTIGTVNAAYRIDVRTEDFILIALSAMTLWFFARRAPGLEPGRGEGAFLGFLVAAEISILNGLFFRTIDKPVVSFLYLLKWCEYFLVFFAALRWTDSEKTSRFFLTLFFLLGLAAAGYGWWEHFFPQAQAVYPNYYRLYERPPFHGDANHLGGFLVLWIGFVLGPFLKTVDRRRLSLFLASLLFVFFPLIWTYSRKSYFALAGVLGLAFFVKGGRRRLLFLISLLIFSALLFPTRLAERMSDLGEVFSSSDPFHSSWAGNWVMWKESLWNFDKFFLFGSGFGSRHRLFYESQAIMILAETGIIGLGAFAFLLISLFREAVSRLKHSLNPEQKGVLWGWLLGGAGLVFHSFSCVSFTVSKVAIPFWFLTGVVLAFRKSPESKS